MQRYVPEALDPSHVPPYARGMLAVRLARTELLRPPCSRGTSASADLPPTVLQPRRQKRPRSPEATTPYTGMPVGEEALRLLSSDTYSRVVLESCHQRALVD